MTSGQDGTASVAVETTALLDVQGDEAVMVSADLEYRPGDCWAVRLVLRNPDGTDVCWTFSWELLAAGLRGLWGMGDVRVRPLPGRAGLIEVVLRRSAEATMLFPARDVRHFVSKVRELAPQDAVTVRQGLDSELATLTEEP